MNWFRAHDGISTDVKYAAVADRSGQPVERVIAVWLHVLDEANKADKRGEPSIDTEAFAAFLRCSPEDIEAILDAMRRPRRDGSPGMLDGHRVTSWGKRNPLREDDGAAERKRRQRDRDRAAQEDRDSERKPNEHDVSHDVTQCHGPSRQIDRKIDRKIDSDTDDAPEARDDGKYRFRGTVVRVIHRDFERWERSYAAIGLTAALQSEDDYLSGLPPDDQRRKKWFCYVSGKLQRLNQRALDERRAKAGKPAVREGVGVGILA